MCNTCISIEKINGISNILTRLSPIEYCCDYSEKWIKLGYKIESLSWVTFWESVF